MAQDMGAQDFVQVRVAIPLAELAPWEKWLEGFEPLSLSVDYQYPGGFGVEPPPLGEDWVWLVALLHNYALAPLRRGLTERVFFVKTLSEEYWRHAWLEHQKPVALGQRLLVYHNPRERALADSYRLAMEIDPRDAFGEGAHPTTRQTMMFLYSVVKIWLRKQGEGPFSLLDVGTGSGLLAVLACLLGLKRVVAFDNDDRAVQGALRNWQANCPGHKALASPEEAGPGYWIGEGDLFSWGQGAYDLVTANLQSEILLRGAKHLASWARPGALLVVSGVWSRWRDEVVARLGQQGLLLAKEKRRQGWCTFLFAKPRD